MGIDNSKINSNRTQQHTPHWKGEEKVNYQLLALIMRRDVAMLMQYLLSQDADAATSSEETDGSTQQISKTKKFISELQLDNRIIINPIKFAVFLASRYHSQLESTSINQPTKFMIVYTLARFYQLINPNENIAELRVFIRELDLENDSDILSAFELGLQANTNTANFPTEITDCCADSAIMLEYDKLFMQLLNISQIPTTNPINVLMTIYGLQNFITNNKNVSELNSNNQFGLFSTETVSTDDHTDNKTTQQISQQSTNSKI